MSAFRSQDAEDMLHRYGSGLPQKIGFDAARDFDFDSGVGIGGIRAVRATSGC